jgi:hypothetical protein
LSSDCWTPGVAGRQAWKSSVPGQGCEAFSKLGPRLVRGQAASGHVAKRDRKILEKKN